MADCYYSEKGYFKDGLVNFSVGTVGPDIMSDCVEIFAKATQEKLSQKECISLFQYGPIQGDSHLIQRLAQFLTSRYGDPVNRDDLITTSGATSGLVTICNLLFTAADYVFISDVSYYANVTYMKHLAYNIVPVSIDKDGMVIDELQTLIESLRDKLTNGNLKERPYNAMVYIIPTFQNPTGRCLSEDRCRQLIQLARKHKLLIFADDVANLIHYDDDNKYPPKRLFAYDCSDDADFYGNVISCGSFSKLLCPGVSKGWLEAPKRVMDLIKLNSPLSYGFNHYMDGIMDSVISLGFLDDYLNKLNLILHKRRIAVKDALTKHMPDYVTFNVPKGGYFVWIDLKVNAEEIAKLCIERHRFAIFPAHWSAVKGGYETQIRFAVCYYNEDVLTDAIVKLASTVKNYKSKLLN